MSTKIASWWMLWGDGPRQLVIDKLKDGTELKDMPSYWRFKPHDERVAVIKQLHDQGSLTNAQLNALFGTPADKEAFYRQAALNRMKKIDEVRGKQLYLVGDKSKTRILPPVYHRLDQVWMRSNKTSIEPEVMNTGHLRNTLLLLKESHGNVMDKIAMSLGAIHTALRNQPGLQIEVVRLFGLLQDLDVDDLYPVFDALQSEYATRENMDATDFVRLHNSASQLVESNKTIDDSQLDIDFNLKAW